MNLSMKQKHTQTQRTDLWVPRRRGAGGDGLGVWDQQMQTIIYRMDKQGPTLQHRKIIQYPVISPNGKEYEKEYVYMYN